MEGGGERQQTEQLVWDDLQRRERVAVYASAL